MLKGGFSVMSNSHSGVAYDEDEALQTALRLSAGRAASPCQVCFKDLKPLSVDQRQGHYDHHFNDAPVASTSTARASEIVLDIDNYETGYPSHTSLAKRTNDKGKERAAPAKENVFWHPSRTTLPPSNYTPGLIPVLRQCLKRSHARGNTLKAALCHEKAVHVATQMWDLGWGCGYRNFLMACTALMEQESQPNYFPLLDGPPAPGVRHLQTWIEEAWSQGYDEEGAAQLKYHLVGTRKWIGTGELCIAFNYRGIPAQLVDFDLTRNGVQVIIDWVVTYFTPNTPKHGHSTVQDALRGAQAIVSTGRMPLILQHAGHSRTIIGYEIVKGAKGKDNTINLLLFDPSKRPPTELREVALGTASRTGSEQPHPDDTSKSHTSRLSHSPSSSPLKSVSRHMSPSRLLHKVGKAAQSAHTHSPLGMRKRKPSGQENGVEVEVVNGTGSAVRPEVVDVDTFPSSGHQRPARPPASKRRRSDSDSNIRGRLGSIEGNTITPVPGSSRTRSADAVDDGDEDDDIICLNVPPVATGSFRPPPGHATVNVNLSPAKVLSLFRLNPKQLGKKDKYQILYFPLTAPLTDHERAKLRVVRSEKVQ